jgi:hypothetical protein
MGILGMGGMMMGGMMGMSGMSMMGMSGISIGAVLRGCRAPRGYHLTVIIGAVLASQRTSRVLQRTSRVSGGVGHLAVIIGAILASHSGDGPGSVLSQTPLAQVEVVDSEIGELVAGVVIEPAEGIKGSVAIIGQLGRRSEIARFACTIWARAKKWGASWEHRPLSPASPLHRMVER